MRALMWFRADLRTLDNAALSAAAHAADRGVVAVFIACPEQWREHDWAGVRVDFMLRTLQVLSKDLLRLNIPLLFRSCPTFAGVPEILAGLAKEHACDALFFNKEYEVNEVLRDARVSTRLERDRVGIRTFTDQTLIEPGEVRTQEGRYFTVFTPFRKALYRKLDETPVTLFELPRRQPSIAVSADEVPTEIEGFQSEVPADLWPAGEDEAQKRLGRFVSTSIKQYKDRRDTPSVDGTSVLSPALAIGAISARQCVSSAMAVNGGMLESSQPGPTHWISEVAWREFYKHVMVGFPRVCKRRAFKPETERLAWSGNTKHLEAWKSGMTGVPIVDAAMRALRATGWMHNRLRMITAMFLTKDLLIDWREGERHFMRHLIDGDLSQNNGGWQWSASTGTDAAPYFRVFNPISQSRKFDPDGAFIRKWVPEVAGLDGGEDGPIHNPSTLPGLARGLIDYPEPIVDREKALERVKKAFAAIKA